MKKRPTRKPVKDLLGETIPEPHRLSFQLTYEGAKRHVLAMFTSGDRVKFQIEGIEQHVGCLDLVPLFWQAMRQNPAGQKSPLQPRTLKGRRIPKEGFTLTKAAKFYGLSLREVKKMRDAGADLRNPDKVGDQLWEITRGKKRVRTSGQA